MLLNAGAWGVYRSNYSDDLRGRLFANLGALDNRERLSLAGDTWSATLAGLVPLEASLALWQHLRSDKDPDVWWSVQSGLGLLDLISPEHVRAQVQRLARSLGTPLFRDMGWEPAAGGETPRLARLRARLVALLGTLGHDPAVCEEASRRLGAAGAGQTALPPDLATAVAQVVAAGGSEAEWELLYSRYKAANTPQDEIRYLQALAGFADEPLLGRSLALAFSDEVRTQDAPFLIMGVLGRREGCRLAWEALESHWEEVLSRWPKTAMARVLEALPALASGGEDSVRRATSWLDAHPVPRGGLRVAQSRERMEVNLAFAKNAAPVLEKAVTSALWALTEGARSAGGAG